VRRVFLKLHPAVRIPQGTTATQRNALALVLTGSVALSYPFPCFCIQLLTSFDVNKKRIKYPVFSEVHIKEH